MIKSVGSPPDVTCVCVSVGKAAQMFVQRTALHPNMQIVCVTHCSELNVRRAQIAASRQPQPSGISANTKSGPMNECSSECRSEEGKKRRGEFS